MYVCIKYTVLEELEEVVVFVHQNIALSSIHVRADHVYVADAKVL